jgi:trigger factor
MKNRFTVFVSSAVLITAAFLLSGCTASYDPDPDDYIRLGQYKGLKVEKAIYEVSEEEMQDELDMLVNAYAKEDGTVPELTDAFIREISGGSIKDLDAYKEALKEQMKSEYDEFYELQYYEDLWNMAVDNAEVIKDFPEAYLQKKTERSVIAAQKYAKSLDMTFSDFVDQKMGLTVDEFNKQAIDYAKVAAKESMVLQAIARAENITVSDEDIEKAIREYVEIGAFESEEAFRNEGPERMEELKEYILISQVQDFLAENAAK